MYNHIYNHIYSRDELIIIHLPIPIGPPLVKPFLHVRGQHRPRGPRRRTGNASVHAEMDWHGIGGRCGCRSIERNPTAVVGGRPKALAMVPTDVGLVTVGTARAETRDRHPAGPIDAERCDRNPIEQRDNFVTPEID
jgi:hypothetical protein